jgi:hypothetical protein
MSPATKKAITIICLLGLIVLAVFGILDIALGTAGLDRLDNFNDVYLEEAFDKALTGFLILSAIKSGLAIVEGSEVGVGFSLELGDAVQPLYDYVDIAWRAAMAGGAIIAMMQLALKGVALVNHWVLAIVLSVVLATILVQWIRPGAMGTWRTLRAWARWGLSLCVIMYLILPLSVSLAAQLSKRLTAPIIATSHDEFREIGDTLSPETLNQRFFKGMDTTGMGLLDIKGRLSSMNQGIKELVAYLKTRSEHMAALTLKLVAAYLFDCILFPLFFGIVLMTLLKTGISQLFDLGWSGADTNRNPNIS